MKFQDIIFIKKSMLAAHRWHTLDSGIDVALPIRISHIIILIHFHINHGIAVFFIYFSIKSFFKNE